MCRNFRSHQLADQRVWTSFCSLDYCYCPLCLYLLVSAKQPYIIAANAYCANLVQYTVLPPRHQHFSAFILCCNKIVDYAWSKPSIQCIMVYLLVCLVRLVHWSTSVGSSPITKLTIIIVSPCIQVSTVINS